jgi:hypothetical protein
MQPLLNSTNYLARILVDLKKPTKIFGRDTMCPLIDTYSCAEDSTAMFGNEMRIYLTTFIIQL